jgi:hypothetical protein
MDVAETTVIPTLVGVRPFVAVLAPLGTRGPKML